MGRPLKAKDFLREGRWLQKQIEADIEKIDQLTAMALRISPVFSKDGGGSGGASSDKIGDSVARLVDYERELRQKVERQRAVLARIDIVISRVRRPQDRLLLTLYYRNFNTWEEVAERMSYTRMQVYRRHGRVLQEIERRLNS